MYMYLIKFYISLNLSEMGGYVGLLLGVSLMDITSLIDQISTILNQKLKK